MYVNLPRVDFLQAKQHPGIVKATVVVRQKPMLTFLLEPALVNHLANTEIKTVYLHIQCNTRDLNKTYFAKTQHLRFLPGTKELTGTSSVQKYRELVRQIPAKQNGRYAISLGSILEESWLGMLGWQQNKQWFPLFTPVNAPDLAGDGEPNHTDRQAVTVQVQCPHCQAMVSAKARFCKHCGSSLASKAILQKMCPFCETSTPGIAHFCPECGYPFQTIVCPECAKEAPANAALCPRCGYTFTEIEDKRMTCSSCGRLLRPGALFCPYCGTDVKKNAETDAHTESTLQTG